jgi:phosphoribosylanthranilate isomerase
MRRVLIKFCGVTEERDATEAVLFGVDAIGFHFFPESPRRISAQRARSIAERLPPFVTKVAVFENQPLIEVVEIARAVGATAVQLGGREAPSLGPALSPLAWYKAIRVEDEPPRDELEAYGCTTFLIDAPRWAEKQDWRRARGLSVFGRIILGGGLDASNVAAAIEQAQPYAVDVATGVEFVPGQTDLNRLEAFVETVRGAERFLPAL